MNGVVEPPVKIRRIGIRDYKGIDELELEFPAPRFSESPDILVMGSRNGLGKTSVIECCASLLLAPVLSTQKLSRFDHFSAVNIPDLLIRAGAEYAKIEGEIVRGEQSATFSIWIRRSGEIEFSGEGLLLESLTSRILDPESEAEDFLRAICGFSPNPVIGTAFLLFHSYRKVQEGNPEMGMMVRDRSYGRRIRFSSRFENPTSAFKLEILHAIMNRANLFEFDGEGENGSGNAIDYLNELVKTYAGGTISKLRPSHDNTLDVRVYPEEGGKSYAFDGLSSGQKEIISTLFLIWNHTRHRPSVVFIDEPELHLNAQWHRRFVKNLISLVPENQYVIATHSEDVMDSVDIDRRVLLSIDQSEGE